MTVAGSLRPGMSCLKRMTGMRRPLWWTNRGVLFLPSVGAGEYLLPFLRPTVSSQGFAYVGPSIGRVLRTRLFFQSILRFFWTTVPVAADRSPAAMPHSGGQHTRPSTRQKKSGPKPAFRTVIAPLISAGWRRSAGCGCRLPRAGLRRSRRRCGSSGRGRRPSRAPPRHLPVPGVRTRSPRPFRSACRTA